MSFGAADHAARKSIGDILVAVPVGVPNEAGDVGSL
jgi:hypothetical protein